MFDKMEVRHCKNFELYDSSLAENLSLEMLDNEGLRDVYTVEF